MWEPWKYRVLRIYLFLQELKREWCLKPCETRTQKFIMGVIVTCGFCAKNPYLILFQEKQWFVFPRMLQASRFYLFWTLTNLSVCSSLLYIGFFLISGLCSGSASYGIEEYSDRFRISWKFDCLILSKSMGLLNHWLWHPGLVRGPLEGENLGRSFNIW